MMAALGPGADEEKITDYCEGSVEHYNWLVDNGVPFKEEFLRPTRLGNTLRRRTHVFRRARTRHRSTRSRHRPLAGTFHR